MLFDQNFFFKHLLFIQFIFLSALSVTNTYRLGENY